MNVRIDRPLVLFGALGLLLHVLACLTSNAQSLQLLSKRDTDVLLSVTANGDSASPVISPDGRYVVFNSSASDLITNDNDRLNTDVFVGDRWSNATVLVSRNLNGDGGGNGNSVYGTISTNGRYVLFESVASDLVVGDTNQGGDIFMRDLLTGTNIPISVALNGKMGNAASSDAVMTPDGRYVAFVSLATDLRPPSDSVGTPDIFIRDTLSNTTALVTTGVTLSGAPYMSPPVITSDGRYVAFISSAGRWLSGPSSNAILTKTSGEVFVRDMASSSVTWVSSNASLPALPLAGNFASQIATISDDGRWVAFKFKRSNAAHASIYLYDTNTQTYLTLVTNAVPETYQLDNDFGPWMTPDGRFISYVNRQANTNFSQLQLWDNLNGSNILVSVDVSGALATNSHSRNAVMTPDGRFIAFLSNATNLTDAIVTNGYHLYVRDVVAGTNYAVDFRTNGTPSIDNDGEFPSVSPDGRFVAFSTRDDALVAGDRNGMFDVFVRDAVSASTELISSRHSNSLASVSGNSLSSLSLFSMSEDGNRIAFSSYASDLVANDTNRTQDVFVYDVLAGTNILVSVATNGRPALGGYSGNPAISADGRYVVFVSAASNINALAATSVAKVFRRDLQSNTTTFLSASTGDASPVISRDGRFVTLAMGSASSLQVYRHDTQTGTNLFMPASSSTIQPSMSLDGRCVAYGASSAVRVFDADNMTNIYTSPASAASMALSPGGTRLLLLNNFNALSVVDLQGNSNLVSFPRCSPVRTAAQWSTNDRFFVFVTVSNAVPQDVNFTNDVYLYDLMSRKLTLVSFGWDSTTSIGGGSDAPVISADGRFIVFRSYATNIVSGVTNRPNFYVHDRLSGSNALLSSASGRPSLTTHLARPAISGDGKIATWQSWTSRPITNDLNHVQDVILRVVAVAADTDDDGIPDTWMLQYFGHVTGEAGDFSRPEDDADGDGMSNKQEFIAGTIPTDPASLLQTDIAFILTTNHVALNWVAFPARAYRVQYKDDVNDAQWQNAPGQISIEGSNASYSEGTFLEKRLYRISVE